MMYLKISFDILDSIMALKNEKNAILTSNFLKMLLLGAKSTSIRDCVRWSVGPLVGRSPTMRDYEEK
jgi:hypothetical protein